MADFYLIVGLGNPGPQYARSWHNYGFMALEVFAQQQGLHIRQAKHKSLTASLRLGSKTLLLMEPQTHMNRSGEAVAEALAYYKLPPERLLVIYDDLDLPVGQLRMRPGGGAGTHNGMRSILAQLGQDRFPRLRLGIGPKPSHMDLADYVLSPVPKEAQETVFSVLEQAASAISLWVNQGVEAAMQVVNRKPDPRKSIPQKEAPHGQEG